ncbi:MAG: beta-N-acetylhexosaminidase [Myxococcales bacterium FL481]|nr:MAG: beta-N-acetylhexosaminidase [Myxococcales bacterium FL481]
MSALWQPGQLLFCGFEGTAVPRELARLIEQGRVGGVALFARNLRGPAAVRELIRSLRSLAPDEAPLCVAMDQEGGRVQRLRAPWTRWPAMRRLGAADHVEHTRQVAAAMGTELREVGVSLNLAPCVDVDGEADDAIIGDRSFSSQPDTVARHAAAFVRGMQAAHVACCAKHFPGHGGTTVDSHHELPRVSAGAGELRDGPLVPFARVAQADVAAMMTAHILYPAVDPRRPSTISPVVLEILRHELAYDGLVITDDIEMKAVAHRYAPAELAAGAVAAGGDVVLACRHFDVVVDALRGLERSRDAVLEPALQRLVAFKRAFVPRLDLAIDEEVPTGPPYPEHIELAGASASVSGGLDPTERGPA